MTAGNPDAPVTVPDFPAAPPTPIRYLGSRPNNTHDGLPPWLDGKWVILVLAPRVIDGPTFMGRLVLLPNGWYELQWVMRISFWFAHTGHAAELANAVPKYGPEAAQSNSGFSPAGGHIGHASDVTRILPIIYGDDWHQVAQAEYKRLGLTAHADWVVSCQKAK